MIVDPVRGVHYPGSLPELRAWFGADADCRDYLDWLRWLDGFSCPWCASAADWSPPVGPWRCGGCGRRVSTLSGTIFHGTRTPLTVWFEAAWLMTASKQGVSALELQRVCGLGSYQTAWTILHKFRHAMGQAGRDRLRGLVEVDETLVGGFTPGRRGRVPGAKALVAVAVERRGRRLGRIRMRVISSASKQSLAGFLRDTVEPGATAATDGWRAYPAAASAAGVAHLPVSVNASGGAAHEYLPGVHRVFSLAKRMLEGTYQSGIQRDHLQAYLDEFVFRFNRRNAKQRGLLFLRLLENAVVAPPAGYEQIALNHTRRPVAHPVAASHRPPTSLDQQPAHHPWRQAA